MPYIALAAVCIIGFAGTAVALAQGQLSKAMFFLGGILLSFLFARLSGDEK